MANSQIEELEQWFTKQPLWLQEAARRFIRVGSFNDQDVAESTLMCKREAGIQVQVELPEAEVRLPCVALPASAPLQPFRLVSMSAISGINALCPRYPLQLGPGPLTTVYGANASGKSGYVRALKHAAGARIRGTLHGNVFSQASADQTCCFEISVAGKTKRIDWDAANGPSGELRCMAIYDAMCARDYVNSENEVSFEPWILRLFTALTEVCLRVNQQIKDEIDHEQTVKPRMPEQLTATDAAGWYTKLDHERSASEIEERCSWDPRLQEQLSSLKFLVAQAGVRDRLAQLEMQNRNITELVRRLQGLRANLADEKCMPYITAKERLARSKKAADEDAQRVFSNAPLEGVGSESWKLLWEQARRYSEEVAYRGIPFPNTAEGARCVLCQQGLDGESRERLDTFERFIKSGLQEQVRDAETELATVRDNLKAPPKDEELVLLLDSAGVMDEDLREQILDFCAGLQKRYDTLIEAAKLAEIHPLVSQEALSKLAGIAEEHVKEIEELRNAANPQRQEELERAVRELEVRRWLHENRQGIEVEVRRLRHIQELEQACKLTSTQQLSLKKSIVAEQVITAAYVDRFNQELSKLRAVHVQVELKKTRAERGKVYHQLHLKNCCTEVPPAEVLSEGEFRIISLAAFLADMEANPADTPFLFDDPISSLDQDFEEATVSRLVELCKRRQVIVFTHRLSLVSLLEEAAKKQGVEASLVFLRREPWGAGEPGEAPMFSLSPDKALNVLSCDRLPAAEKVLGGTGQAAYDIQAKAICSEVRILLERVIEHELLADVVKRFRRQLHTQKIMKLARINSEDCRILDELMTKYSRYEHSQPEELPVILPAPEEIRQDLQRLKAWLSEFKDRSAQ